MSSVMSRMRPETGAGGFSRFDGTLQFYIRVNTLLKSDMVVVDLGAGRGVFLERGNEWGRALQTLKGKVKEVVGLDVDPAISQNPALDRYELIDPLGSLPLPDQSVDMIVSDWTLEHIDHAEHFAAEVGRVLKPGGWLCARTPHKWSLTGLFARAIPNALHVRVLNRVQPGRKEVDVFPVRYRMNTQRDLNRLFPPSCWENFSYSWKGDPAYHAESGMIWKAMTLIFHFMPNSMANSFMIFLQKRG